MKKIISIIGFTIACLFIFSAEAVERRVANNAEFAEAYSLSLDNDEITVTNFDYYYVVGGINVGEPGYILDRN